jgi:glycosyltransferase involved in cell wall biosynthesis
MLSVIANIKEDYEIDLIHFDTISLAYYLPGFSGIPKVLDHHNIESHMMLRRAEQESNFLKRFYFNLEGNKLLRYERRVCCEFDLHITCSSLDSSRLADIDSSLTIREVPNGVDIDYFYPQSGKEIDGHLVFAGGLGWYPNADAMRYFAVEIWPILKKRVPDIVMNVVGKNPSVLLTRLGEEDSNFRVHGFVDDVREYIASASVYVCPIRDGGGTKLKLLDAFAMGMATVAHPAACEGLEVTEGKNILLASTAEEFSAKIDVLIRDKELRKTLGLNARKLVVEKYSFKTIGQHLSDLYSQMV